VALKADRAEPARYDHGEVEPRWQRFWHEHATFRAVRRPGREKRYVLVEAVRFNTAISGMMELLNHLSDLPDPLPREAVRTLILLVSPFAPHVAEELWQTGGHDVERTGTLAHQAWPTWDEALCQEDTVEIAVQVNGRVRGRVVLPHTASAEAARTAALGADGVAPHVAGRTVRKFVYVPGKIVNVVVG